LVKVVKDGVVVENVYDVDGVLVKSGGVDLLVDTSGGLSHVVAEIGSGGVEVVYVRAGDMLLEEIRGGVARMYEADGLGSVRGMLDVSGARTDTWSYEAFGTTVGSTGNSVNPYRFAGERWVADVGMYQNRARWLDTRVGRFVSYDHVLTANYRYSHDDPVNRLDPSGNIDYTLAGRIVVGVVAGLLIVHGARRIADWYSHGKLSKAPVRDVTVIGDQNGWNGWWGAFWRSGEIGMSSASDMVGNIVADLRPGQHIGRLNIFDHGDEDEFLLGEADVVNMKNFDSYKGIFRMLTPLFAPGGDLFLGHCYIGKNKRLIKRVADAVGVPVIAGTGFSVEGVFGSFRFNTGSYVRCEPSRDECTIDRLRP
jgi:RHS repeat-associated protein